MTLVRQHRTDEVPELALSKLNRLNEVDFAKLIASQASLPFIDLKNAQISADTVAILKKSSIRKFKAIPIQNSPEKITLAVFELEAIFSKKEITQEIRKAADFIVTDIASWKKLYLMARESVDDLIKSIVEVTEDGEQEKDIREEEISEDVITFVNRILADAYVRKVSDIHVEPYEKIFRIRYRLDGSLKEVAKPPKSMMLPIISRLKIMAQLDIAEKRKPQDGRIKLKMGGSAIDFRVSCLPTLFGEKVVLRLLDQSNLQLDMTTLGFAPKQLAVFKEGIHKPYGMCLVTGPTGSGKTTTLYSALAELNDPNTNISTCEDPCEFNLEGINQVNVRKDIGLTFAAALKSFLRQDPDIIMVGEIRDHEVGEIAIEASLTGHMVLSTMHTNDAPSAVTRLINMGIEPFLIVASLNVVVAQRLMRKICMNCRVQADVSVDQLIACGVSKSSAQNLKVYRGKGCKTCGGSGYKGRLGIHEVLHLSNNLKDLVLKNVSTEELKQGALKEGMQSLRMSALMKVAQGLTTLEEAVANSASDNN